MESAVTLLPQPDSPTSATTLALVDVERDAVEGSQHAAVGRERDGEIPDPEERRRHRTYASRRGPAPPVTPIVKADPIVSSP